MHVLQKDVKSNKEIKSENHLAVGWTPHSTQKKKRPKRVLLTNFGNKLLMKLCIHFLAHTHFKLIKYIFLIQQHFAEFSAL